MASETAPVKDPVKSPSRTPEEDPERYVTTVCPEQTRRHGSPWVISP